MRHVKTKDLFGSTALTLKEGEETDPADIVTKALADLTKTVDERLAKVEAKSDTTKIAGRLDKLEAKANRPDGGDQNEGELSLERKAFAAYLRYGGSAPEPELKALTVGSDPQGGYFAPAEMSSELIRDLVEYSPVRSVASVRQTGNPSVVYPKRTGGMNAKWKGEAQEQEGSEPGFGPAELVTKELNTYVDISNQLLADSAGQAEAEVRLALTEDFGQKEGLAFVSGDGILEPEGFMSAAGIAEELNGHATDLKPDQMIKMLYSLPAMYRNNGVWALNGTTLGIIRTLKDGDGRMLWQPSFAAGQPETILGRPVVEMVDMPDIAANAFPIAYGDFSGYRIVDRVEMSTLVNPFLLATTGMTRIHATRRVAGGMLQPAKFRKLKMST